MSVLSRPATWCGHCPRAFETLASARAHETFDHRPNALVCGDCGAVYASPSGLTRHQGDAHGAPRVSLPPKHPRTPCPWPGCENTKPAPWNFCSARDCQRERMQARALGQIYDSATGEWTDVTDAHREVMDTRENKRIEQARRWNNTPASREARRRWKRENPEKVAEQVARYQERLRAVHAAHRRRMERINQSNQLFRKQQWERAMSDATADLLLLIQDQKKDAERWSEGDRWTAHLDASFRDDGQSAHDFYSALRYDGGPWADPTFDAVAARLEIEERLAS